MPLPPDSTADDHLATETDDEAAGAAATTKKPTQRFKFTQARINALRPPSGSAITYWAADLPGFGCRVSPLGRKTWLAQYRVKGAGKEGKDLEVVETFSTTDKVTLEQAQRQARESFTAARQGINPVAERKQQRGQHGLTFAALAERYMNEYVIVACKPSTISETRRYLAKASCFAVAPSRSFGQLNVASIKRNDIDLMMAPYKPRGSDTGGLVAANQLLGTVQRCFRWAKSQALIVDNPAVDVPMPLKTVPTRDRVLTDAEIKAFWIGCDQLGWPFGPLFKLLLLTGQRLNEVAGMRWAELDLEQATWLLPAARTKNSKAHEVALSAAAMEILAGLPHIEDSDFVFPSADSNKPVSGFSAAKGRLEGSMASETPWRLHDLRRSMTTGLARLGVAPHIADKILNHQSGGVIHGVAAVYNRFAYLNERREALCQWGAFLAQLTGNNVVALRSR
jgi:integrase